MAEREPRADGFQPSVLTHEVRGGRSRGEEARDDAAGQGGVIYGAGGAIGSGRHLASVEVVTKEVCAFGRNAGAVRARVP
jgi:hypothetical protein